MNRAIVQSDGGITLVGGAPVGAAALRAALSLAPRLVAADGGADRALAAGLVPEAVIGDLDSISASASARIGKDALHRIAEQQTTDFDKALRHVAAPFVLALGFAGARADHSLAVFNTLVRHADRCCLILSGRDLCFVAPPALTLALRPGTRLSLFPMGPVRGESEGLEYPLAGQDFAPDGMIGTSNRVSAPQVRLRFSARRMLVILPRAALSRTLLALAPAAVTQPVRGG